MEGSIEADGNIRLIFKEIKVYWKLKNAFGFHVFEHLGSDVVELFVYDTSNGKDLNRLCFAKSVLTKLLREDILRLFNERISSLEIIRQKGQDCDFDMEDGLIRQDIVDRLIGEYIVSNVAVEAETADMGNDAPHEYIIEFIPPDLDESLNVVIPRPLGLSPAEPYREKEINRSKSLKYSSLKNSVIRQRKETTKGNVIGAFKGALLAGLMNNCDVGAAGAKSTAIVVSPAKSRWQKSVKKIILRNAVSKMSGLLTTEKAASGTPSTESADVVPGSNKSAVPEMSSSRFNYLPYSPQQKSKKRSRNRLGPIASKQKLDEPIHLADAVSPDSLQARETAAEIPVDGGSSELHVGEGSQKVSSRSKARGFMAIKKDAEAIEKEVALTETVIEAFHNVVLNSLRGQKVEESSSAELYKPTPPSQSAAKTRWKKSVKRIILQKAVAKVNVMLHAPSTDLQNVNVSSDSCAKTESKGEPGDKKATSQSTTSSMVSNLPIEKGRSVQPVGFSLKTLPPVTSGSPGKGDLSVSPTKGTAISTNSTAGVFGGLFHSRSHTAAKIPAERGPIVGGVSSTASSTFRVNGVKTKKGSRTRGASQDLEDITLLPVIL